MKKKKSNDKRRTTKVRGVSFPTDMWAVAKKNAEKQNRNVSNYLLGLVIQDTENKGINNG